MTRAVRVASPLIRAKTHTLCATGQGSHTVDAPEHTTEPEPIWPTFLEIVLIKRLSE
jgi:hypothetical protein